VKSRRPYPWLRIPLLGLCGLTILVVLYLTSYINFFSEEWDLISRFRPSQATSVFEPHDGQWSTIPILIWKGLFTLVGIRSHTPFEIVLLGFHVASVLLLFELIRRRSGDLPAFFAALVLLVLGSGGTNIVWAFQIGFVAAVMFGLLALLILDSPVANTWRGLVASAALLASVMCGGVGLAFLAAAGVGLSVDPRRRRLLWSLALPALSFTLWFFAYDTDSIPGASTVGASLHRGPVGIAYLQSVIDFVTSGLQASVGGVLGIPGVGIALLPVVTAAVAIHWYRRGRVESWQVGLVVGVVSYFTLTSLGLAQNGSAAAGESRYVYVGVVFLLPLMADAARTLFEKPRWRPTGLALLFIGLFVNALQLADRALVDPIPSVALGGAHTDIIRTENVELQTAEVFRGAPDMSLNRALDGKIMPQLIAADYYAAIDELGSPVSRASLEGLKQMPGDAVDRVMLSLFGPAMTVTPARNLSPGALPCRYIDSSKDPTMDLEVPAGESFMLQTSVGGNGSAYLSFLGPRSGDPIRKLQFEAGLPELIRVPDTGRSMFWQLRIALAPMGVVRVCGTVSRQLHHAVNNLYPADAGSGALDAGWLAVNDPAANGVYAAKAAMNVPPSKRDVFGTAFAPLPGVYDVWVRVRVAKPKRVAAELRLGLWDDTEANWVGSKLLRPKDVGLQYTWIKVAAGVAVPSGHYVQYMASVEAKLGGDWYVDGAFLKVASPLQSQDSLGPPKSRG
jgi:hypothetical protein